MTVAAKLVVDLKKPVCVCEKLSGKCKPCKFIRYVKLATVFESEESQCKCYSYSLQSAQCMPQYVPCLQTLRFPEGTARSGCPMRSYLALDHDISQTPHELGECHHRNFPSFSSETSVVQCHFFCLLCMESP